MKFLAIWVSSNQWLQIWGLNLIVQIIQKIRLQLPAENSASAAGHYDIKTLKGPWILHHSPI
jgi:hypothetical protein